MSEWKRQTRYRNFINQRLLLPKIVGGRAVMQSGAEYTMYKDGWKRENPK